MSNRKYGSDKEVAAVTINVKEQRCLEKSLQTLSLEQTYSLKLLDLNHRIIRVNYRRLKDRVSRIKSNLSPDEITELRRLESAGKLKPTYNSVNLSSALKIAAAARRLNFNVPGKNINRAKSAHPRLRGRVHSTSNQHLHPPSLPGMCRSNSVTGVFIDAPEPEVQKRRGSVDVIRHNEKLRPFSAFNAGQDHARDGGSNKRPATTSCLHLDKTRLSRPTTSVPRHCHSPYSSHSLSDREHRHYSVDLSTNGRFKDTKASYPVDDSIDSNLGEDLYEERRQDLLDDELERAEELEQRKDDFIRAIDLYLKKANNPGLDLEPSLMTPTLNEVSNKAIHQKLSKRQQRKVDFDHTPTFAHEADYRKRLFDLWKDMNKCRYLRVPEEIIDLSGIATLAKDQLRLFNVLKQSEENTLAASVEL